MKEKAPLVWERDGYWYGWIDGIIIILIFILLVIALLGTWLATI